MAVGLLSAPASTVMAPVGAWSRALDPQSGTLVVDRLCNCTPDMFALESRVSKNTSGITPYHSPSGARVLSAHIEMSKACCFCKCGVWPIDSELLAADPVVLAHASVPIFLSSQAWRCYGHGCVPHEGRGGKALHESLQKGQKTADGGLWRP